MSSAFTQWGSPLLTGDTLQEQQRAFYVQIRDLGGKAMLAVAETVAAVDETTAKFAEGGAYLPLSVWEKQGFDVASIQAKTADEDKREDSVNLLDSHGVGKMLA
jgi:hypothetical protein